MKRRIVVVGFFEFGTSRNDGQTVKTQNILELIKQRHSGSEEIDYFDTYLLHKQPLYIFSLIWVVASAKRVVYLPAHNNLKYFSVPLALLSLVCRFKVIHVTVGGWLASFLDNHSGVKWAISKFSVVLCETIIDKELLQERHGLKHVKVFPNFRMDRESDSILSVSDNSEHFRIVFMARINRMKGLDWIETLAYHIEQQDYGLNVTIDLFGPIAKEDEHYFEEMLSRHPESMMYHGVLDPREITRTLSRYDVLTLPTHYYTEGFPGSILDAYRSGIPVIVTQWLHAKQFVQDGESGFVIPFEHGDQDLCDKVDYLINNPNKLKDLKRQAYAESMRYKPEVAWQILEEYL